MAKKEMIDTYEHGCAVEGILTYGDFSKVKNTKPLSELKDIKCSEYTCPHNGLYGLCMYRMDLTTARKIVEFPNPCKILYKYAVKYIKATTKVNK